jgi:flagellar biosynthesis protein FlhG
MLLSSTPGLVLAIVSGKGGVGKSTLSVNLAEALAAAGHRTALLDADIGQGSCSTLLNETPSATAAALARGAVPVERLFHRTEAGLTLISGGASAAPTGVPDALYGALDDALDAASRSHDVVLIDAPAGTDGPVRWALDRADAAILILVGEPTAVTGAYTLAKMVWTATPDYPLLAVVNAADTEADAQQTTDRFGELTMTYLGASPTPLGWIPYDAHVRAAVRTQTPAIRLSGSLRASFGALADRVAALLPASASRAS